MPKITIESTEEFTEYDGIRVRIWKGATDSGVDCLAYVKAVMLVGDGENDAALEAEVARQEAEGMKTRLRGTIDEDGVVR